MLCKHQECVTRALDRDMKFLLKFKFIIVQLLEGRRINKSKSKNSDPSMLHYISNTEKDFGLLTWPKWEILHNTMFVCISSWEP